MCVRMCLSWTCILESRQAGTLVVPDSAWPIIFSAGVRHCMDYFLPLMKTNGRVSTVSSQCGNKLSLEAMSAEMRKRFMDIQDLNQLDAFATSITK